MDQPLWPGVPPLPPPLPQAPPPLPERRHQPQFTGTAREFFGIWFVNLILSILTLGIYSAWAKVRTERYFYSNTRLAGSTFDYIANPIAILKGRLIAYAVVILLVVSNHFLPLVYLLIFVLLFLLMPAFIVLSLRFRARNSVWRGIGFRFDQPVSEGYMPFMMWRLISSMTLGLLSPLAQLKQQEFVVEGHRYGTRRFRFKGDLGQYYLQFVIALGTGIGTAIVLISVAVLIALLVKHFTASDGATIFASGFLVALSIVYLLIFVLMAFLQVRYTNLLWRNASLGPHTFESTLRARRVLWIYASNALAIVFSLGLAVPWAMIRLARYRAEHWALLAMGDLDDFAASSDMNVRATGAELVEALDAGLDFGI